jgi:hypothetical protein
MRSIDCGASWVCSVAKTRWPVSAAVRAVEIVSRSRSSPMRMTSGSWRRTCFSASPKPLVSSPTSRWLTTAILCRCRYSMGSSTDMIWIGLVELMMSMSAARVVDLPEPVGPVTSTSPRGRSANWRTVRGRPSCSGDIISNGMVLNTAPMESRCWKTLSRKRPIPGTTCEVSSSRLFSKRSRSRCDKIS